MTSNDQTNDLPPSAEFIALCESGAIVHSGAPLAPFTVVEPETLTRQEIDRLPLDEQIYLAFVDALGQDEDAAQDALDMVLPFLRKVWADGYLTGVLDERDHRDAPKVKTANPFGGSL